MTEPVDAARARIAAGEAEVAAGRADLVAAMGELANAGWSVERVADHCGVSFATAKNAIAAHRKLHPRPVDPRPPLRDRRPPGAVRPVVAESPARPPGAEWARERPPAPPAAPEPNPNPDEVDF